MTTNNNITIYTDSLCPFSKELIADLSKAGVSYKLKLADKDMEAAIEMNKLTQDIKTPVVKIVQGEIQTVLVGYTNENKKKLEQLLQVNLEIR